MISRMNSTSILEVTQSTRRDWPAPKNKDKGSYQGASPCLPNSLFCPRQDKTRQRNKRKAPCKNPLPFPLAAQPPRNARVSDLSAPKQSRQGSKKPTSPFPERALGTGKQLGQTVSRALTLTCVWPGLEGPSRARARKSGPKSTASQLFDRYVFSLFSGSFLERTFSSRWFFRFSRTP